MIYSREKQEAAGLNFNSIISTYIESGIPVIAVLKNDILGHAVNIIGREIQSNESIVAHDPHFVLDDRLPIIDFNQVVPKICYDR